MPIPVVYFVEGWTEAQPHQYHQYRSLSLRSACCLTHNCDKSEPQIAKAGQHSVKCRRFAETRRGADKRQWYIGEITQLCKNTLAWNEMASIGGWGNPGNEQRFAHETPLEHPSFSSYCTGTLPEKERCRLSVGRSHSSGYQMLRRWHGARSFCSMR